MKKILALVAILAIGFGSINAQENFKWGVTAGVNVSSLNVTGMDSKVGFHAGVKAEVGLPQVTEGAYMEFGTLLTLKGAKIEVGSVLNAKISPYYLEFPIHVGYKYPVNEDFTLFFNAGPYVAIGLFGKMTAGGDIVDGDSESVDAFSEEGGLKRFDLGLGVKAGMEFNQKLQVSVGYDFGLAKVENESGLKNRNFMISLGVLF